MDLEYINKLYERLESTRNLPVGSIIEVIGIDDGIPITVIIAYKRFEGRFHYKTYKYAYGAYRLPLAYIANGSVLNLDSSVERKVLFEPDREVNVCESHDDLPISTIISVNSMEYAIIGKNDKYQNNENVYACVNYPHGDPSLHINYFEHDEIDFVVNYGYTGPVFETDFDIKDATTFMKRFVKPIPLGSVVLVKMNDVNIEALVIDRLVEHEGVLYHYLVKFINMENDFVYIKRENVLDILYVGYFDIKELNYTTTRCVEVGLLSQGTEQGENNVD